MYRLKYKIYIYKKRIKLSNLLRNYNNKSKLNPKLVEENNISQRISVKFIHKNNRENE